VNVLELCGKKVCPNVKKPASNSQELSLFGNLKHAKPVIFSANLVWEPQMHVLYVQMGFKEQCKLLCVDVMLDIMMMVSIIIVKNVLLNVLLVTKKIYVLLVL